RGVEPLALPAARQKMAGFPAGPGLCTPPRRLPAPPGRALLHEIELPVRLLDAHVKLAYLPGQVVRLRPQQRYREGSEHLELRAQLTSHACLAPSDCRVGGGGHDRVAGTQHIPAGERVGGRGPAPASASSDWASSAGSSPSWNRAFATMRVLSCSTRRVASARRASASASFTPLPHSWS